MKRWQYISPVTVIRVSLKNEETEAAEMNENSKRVTRTGWLIVANMTPVFAYSGQAGYQLAVSWYSWDYSRDSWFCANIQASPNNRDIVPYHKGNDDGMTVLFYGFSRFN